jgi:phospholipase/carboxylesterase
MELPIEWLPATGRPEQLILLLHGWRSDGRAMAPLAQALRNAFPQAAVLAPDSPLAFEREPGLEEEAEGLDRGPDAGPDTDPDTGPDTGRDLGRMWYSIEGITPGNWPGRVAGCLPPLIAWVRAQQQRLGVGPAATALGGFSQGAILALAAALQEDGIAGRVLAFGGCLVAPPEAAPQHTTMHFFHGGSDEVIPADGSRQALAWFGELQGDATLDIAEGIGHELHPALIECALHRLTHHIPLRTWRAALGAASTARAT